MLTPRELQQIREYLLQYGKKDTQFPVVGSMTGNDLIAFVRSNQNLAAHLDDIEKYIGTKIGTDGIAIDGSVMGLTEENFTTLLKTKLGDIEPNAQVNDIEDVKVNGTSLPITSKSVDITLIPTSYVKNYSDPVHPIGELGNQLLGERDINAKIAESEAEFKGTTEPDLTLSEFKTWLGTLTADKNDYVFYVATYTDDRIDSEDEKYIYYRYKYTGATENTSGTPWPCVAGWTYEYQLIPYYLNTDEYPTEGSKNAVESQGIFAFTGNVHKDGNNNYISLQTQIDEIVAGDATTNLTVSPTVALADGTNKTFTFTASASKPATVVFNGGNPISFTGSTPFIVTLNSETPIKNTYNAVFTINGVNVGTKSASAQLAWKVSYGYGTGDYTTAVLTEVSSVKSTPAGDYNINIGTNASHIYFKVQSSMNITKVETIGGVTYEVAMDSPTTVSGWKYYKSTSTFDAGSFSFRVYGNLSN